MIPDVIVVGGGIAGTTVAWELARRGTRVELFEQATLAAGASGRNTGTLLHQVEPVVAAMLCESEERYRELQDGDVDFRGTQREELLLARDPGQLLVVEQKATVLAQQGVATESVAGDALRAAFPAFSGDVLGGAALAAASTVEAEPATRAFAEAARRAGATIRTGARVSQILVADGRVSGVLTDAGPVAAGAVIAATGPWLTELLPLAPMKPGRGWLMRTQCLDFDVPWIVEEVSWPDQAVLGAAASPTPLAEPRGRAPRPAHRRVLPPLPAARRRRVRRRVAVDLAARRRSRASTRRSAWPRARSTSRPGWPRASESPARGGAFAR